MENLFLVLRVVVSLGVVLGLLYVLRRRLVPRAGAGQRRAISVVARQGIGAKTSAVLIDVHGRRYLLGVADQSVSVLDSFAVPAEEDDDVATAPAAAERSDTAPGHDGVATAPATARAAAGDGGRLFALNLNDARRRDHGVPVPDSATRAMPATAFEMLDASVRTGARPGGSRRPQHAPEAASPLAGSILSAQTWRQAATALRRGRSS